MGVSDGEGENIFPGCKDLFLIRWHNKLTCEWPFSPCAADAQWSWWIFEAACLMVVYTFIVLPFLLSYKTYCKITLKLVELMIDKGALSQQVIYSCFQLLIYSRNYTLLNFLPFHYVYCSFWIEGERRFCFLTYYVLRFAYLQWKH